MEKKHIDAFIEYISLRAREAGKDHQLRMRCVMAANAVVDVATKFDPDFDVGKFYTACGVKWEGSS